MKTVITSSILLLFTALLAGCVRDDITPQTGGAGRVLTVNYSFDTPQTRATATGAEREVKDVAIFFYNADDNTPANETYVDCRAVTISADNTSGSFPLPLPTTIVPGNKYKLIIIGNYNRYAPEGKSVADYATLYNNRTYSQMKQKIQGELSNPGTRVTNPLPYWGRLLGTDGSETTLTGPVGTEQLTGVSVRFSRAVARFDVANLAADQLKIAWVKVCNYRNKGYFFHETLLPGEIVRGTTTDVPQGPPYPSGIIGVPAPSGPAGSLQQKLDGGGLYAFPNTVSYTSQDDKATTCLLIAGYFKEKGAADYSPTLTYYRANVSENGSSQVLHRNYVYTLVINSVKKPGADTEEGAMNEKEKLLDYVTNDSWESGDSSTVTDSEGNFLTLSRTSVVLDAQANESALIKVAVKKGTDWTVIKNDDPDGAFRCVRVNDESFSIFTNSDNPGDFIHKATLTVKVTGIAATVQLTVNVTQLSSKNDLQMLLVEGKTGAFDYTVPGQGGDVSLQVITGSPTSKWKTTMDDNLKSMLSYYNTEGVNKGFIKLSFLPDISEPRHGTLTVIRLLADGVTPDPDVANVVITFRQAKNPYTVTLAPDYSKEGLTIEGFLPDNTKSIANGICDFRQFLVLLADPAHYTFKATCSFNLYSDAFITKDLQNTSNLQAGPIQSRLENPSTVEGQSGDNIFLYVFRTGPGDADITGDITVTAVPNAGTNLPTDTYTVPITITTSCKIGDSYVDGLLWADRNVGAMPRGLGGAAVGLNYTNETSSDDHGIENEKFKGNYYNFSDAQAQSVCPAFGTTNRYDPPLNDTKWRIPNHVEQDAVAKRMLFSKERAYIVSDKQNESGETVGCWFPLSGYSFGTVVTAAIYGYYWSSTLKPNSDLSYILNIYKYSANSNGANRSYGYSVRCVRPTQ